MTPPMLFIGSAYSDVCVTACSPWAVCVYRTVWQWDITAGRDPRKAFRVNSNPEVQKDRENVFERLKLTLLAGLINKLLITQHRPLGHTTN